MAEPFNIIHLPEHILIQMFSYMSYNEISESRQVILQCAVNLYEFALKCSEIGKFFAVGNEIPHYITH